MKITDEQLLAAILSGDPRQRDWGIYQFYNDALLRNSVIQYVKKQGGTEEDGKDIFQESICIFDRNLRQGKFNGQSTLNTYFFAIAKWHWITFRRKNKVWTELEPNQIEGTVESVDAQIFQSEEKILLDKAINKLGSQCQQLLQLYKLDYSMKEITSLMDFSSSNMAKKQAYRCRERLRKVFLNNPSLLKALNINLRNV